MPGIRYYSVCGLTLESHLDLPLVGLDEQPAPGLEGPDILIHLRPVPETLPEARHTGPTWQVTDRQILLRIPGVARFLMTEGREIAIQQEGNQSEEDFQIFLLGSGLGALMHQRGALALHAGAVSVNGEAVLFCGHSGAGKSSLVAALSGAGYPLIADDICLLSAGPAGRAIVAPDGRRLKLWADAIENLAVGAGQEQAVRPGLGKYWVKPPSPTLNAVAAVRAVYFLRDETPPHQSGIETLRDLDAFTLLRDNAYRPQLVTVLGQEGLWFDRAVSLLSSRGAFLLTRRMSFDALPDCLQSLERHWHAMGY